MKFKSKVYGKYILLDRIAAGGMAEVFKAKSFGMHGFERLLVIKRILPHLTQDEEFIEMFIDEAKIAVELNHANICQVNDLGKIEDNYFIAMEFIDGKDLRTILKKSFTIKTPLEVPQTVYIILEALKGLDYAHNKMDPITGKSLKLIHRDISPQNIMLSYHGEVKIVDFGIAKTESKLHRTQAGVLKGKFGYMSPEQASGLELSQRSDLFSMGIILFETLSGRRLFHSDTDFKTLEAIKICNIPSIRKYNPNVTPELEAIILKSLAKDPKNRFANAQAMHSALSKVFYQTFPDFNVKNLSNYLQQLFQAEINQEKEFLKRAMDTVPQNQIEKASKSSEASFDLDRVKPIRLDKTVSHGKYKADQDANTLYSVNQHPEKKSRKWLLALGILGILGLGTYMFMEFKNKNPKPPKVELAELQDISISSSPEGATLIVENETKGITPFSLSFKTNKVYEIQLRKAGYKNLEDQILIQPNQEALSFTLKKKEAPSASLFIDSIPQGARILVNGEDRDLLTPANIYKLKQGQSLTLTLEKDGFKSKSQSIELDQKLKELMFDLEKEFASLRVNVNPKSASIKLNGKTQQSLIKNLDPKKTYTLAISAKGYHSVSKKVSLEGAVTEIDIELKKRVLAKGYINISAIPWATVIIDGEKLGSTPILNHELTVGTHSVVFQHQDYPDLKKTINIKKGENQPLIIDFAN